MSRTIDERIVEMQFDNQNFEKNVRTSLSTLDKLKESLDFKGVATSFDEIERASSKVDFSSISSGLDKISSGFSALETIAVGALLKIGSSAVDAGAKLIKSLTVDQIAEGWEKFSDKTTSVATLVSQGYELQEVNDQLDRLNWFTDETSYNFTDMVANIAKFTAAGKGLEESVTAMEGIANWAALSGQNATTASRAMYQISQALGAGYMRLEDWKSIQNVSMDTDEFRQKALDAAVALGTLQKNVDGTYQSMVNRNADEFTKSQFAQHLTEDAWFTADVMMRVFNDYSAAVDQIYEYSEEKEITASQAIEELGDEVDEFGLKAFKAAQEARTFADVIDATKDAVSTGWMNTFQLIFGNYEEAKTLWTDLANNLWDVFAGPQAELNTILEQWKNIGGREDLFSHKEYDQGALWNLYDSLFKFDEEANRAIGIVAIIKQAFHDIFPETTVWDIKNITQAIQDFTAKLILSDEKADKLRNTFKGVFAVFDIIRQAVSAVWRVISPMLGGIGTLGDKILDITSDTGEWLANLAQGLRENDTIFKAIQPFAENVQKIWSTVIDWTGQAIDKLREWWGAVKEYLGTINWTGLKEGFAGFSQSVNEHVGKAIDKVIEWKDTVSTKLHNIDWGSVWQSIKDAMSKVAEWIGKGIEKIKEWWAAISEKHDTSNFEGILNLVKTLAAGGIGVALVELIRNITKPIKDLKGGLSDLLEGLQDVLKAYKTEKYAETMKEIAIAIGILAAALFVISKIDPNRLLNSTLAITALMADLVGAMKLMDNAGGKKGAGKAMTMIGLAGSILLLADALQKIAEIDSEKIASSTAVITALIFEMVGATALLGKTGKGGAGALTMLGLAAAVKILASVIEDVKDLSWEEIGKGLSVVAGSLLSIAGATRLMPSGAKMVGIGVGLIAVSAALEIIGDVINKMALLSWEELGKGLAVIAGAMFSIAAATRLMPSGVKMMAIGISLIAVGAALEIIADVVKKMAFRSWENLGKGMAVIAASLLLIAGATQLMPSGGKMLAIGVSLIAVGAALEIIADVVTKMSALSWEEIGKGLLTLGGSLLVLSMALQAMKGTMGASAALLVASVALAVLASVMKTIGDMSWESIAKGLVAIAGAFAILGAAGYILAPVVTVILSLSASLLLAGLGMTAFGAGLLAVSVAIAALAGSAGTIGLVITGIVTAIANAIPLIAEKIGEGIIIILKVIGDSTEQLAETFKQIIRAALSVLVELIPEIVEAVLKLVDELLAKCVDFLPDIVAKILDLFILLMQEINARLPEIVHVVVEFLASLFSSIVVEIEALDPDMLLKVLEGIGIVSGLMIACAALSSIAASAMIGVAEVAAFIVELSILVAAIGALNQIPGFTWLIGEGGTVLETLGDAIGRFIGGFVGGIAVGATDELPKVGENLANFAENAEPFIAIAPELSKALLAFATAELIDGIASFFGSKDLLKDFGEQLSDLGPNLVAFSDSVAGKMDVESVRTAMEALQIISDVASNLPNSGGWLGAIIGENDLDDFVLQLKDIGPILTSFSYAVKGVDVDSVKKAMEALQSISDVASGLPNSGGWLGAIIGDNDIDDFIKQLKDIGPILTSFSYAVKGVDVDAVKNAMDALKAISDVASQLPNSGGLWGWIAGDNDIGKFGESLKKFGEGLVGFYEQIKDIVLGKITSAVSSISVLVDSMKSISDGNFSVDSFTSALSKVGAAIIEATNSGIDDHKIDLFNNYTSVLRELVTKGENEKKTFQLLGRDLTDSTAKGINGQDARDTANRSIIDILNSLVESIRKKFTEFEKLGIDAMTKFADGLKAASVKSKANANAVTIATSAITELRNKYNDFQKAGEYAATGFANGMASSNSLSKVGNAARQLANRAINTMKQTLDEHSPSKVTMQIGAYAGEGFVDGVLSYVSPTKNAASQLAAAINSIAESVDSDYEISPVITPVVDMSGVYAARNSIQRMMPDNFALRTISTIGNGVSRDEANHVEIQNQNAGVISELRNMRTDLGSLGNRLARLQVVMDSGALVGAISGPMDSALGTETLKHRRGI